MQPTPQKSKISHGAARRINDPSEEDRAKDLELADAKRQSRIGNGDADTQPGKTPVKKEKPADVDAGEQNGG